MVLKSVTNVLGVYSSSGVGEGRDYKSDFTQSDNERKKEKKRHALKSWKTPAHF